MNKKQALSSFQDLVFALKSFWGAKGFAVLEGYDAPMGAGTFHPATFLRALERKPWRAAYVQPCRRPKDGRYGQNPNRLQHYFQFQVVAKPAPADVQEMYLDSLSMLGVDFSLHDVRFVEDDWASPTLGAWGLGWEVWIDGMEVTQFTYFQEVAGFACEPPMVEITYGLERLAMYLLGVDNVFRLPWNSSLTYGDLYLENEETYSCYNFEEAKSEVLFSRFAEAEKECLRLLEKTLPSPAYDFLVEASHLFNLLDARGALAVAERAQMMARVRGLARRLAKAWRDKEEASGQGALAHS